MAGVLGHLQPFEAGENWQEYVEIFEHFFIANDIVNDKKKVCILCSNVGSATYHIIKSLCLPQRPESKTFTEICLLVNNHFKPKLSEASASLQFYSRSRKKEESIQMFLAELRRLAGPCNFGQFVTRALRDRFIAGINNEQIQEKILTLPDDELTLDRAFKIAESHETASRNVKEMQTSVDATADGVMKVNIGQTESERKSHFYERKRKGSQSQTKRITDCFRCGGGHSSNQCYFKEKHCYVCGRKGHVKAKCDQNYRSGGRVKNIDDSDEDEDKVEHIVVCSVQSKNKVPAMMCEIKIQGTPIEFEIDTGSPYTIMSQETVNKLFGRPDLCKSGIKIKSFTGHSVKVLGLWNIQAELKGKQVENNVLVTEFKHNLLGRDLIKKLDVLTVNLMEEPIDTCHFQAKEIINKYTNLFEEGLGKIKGVKAKIHIPKDATPIYFKARSIPYAMREKVEKELQRLQEDDVIESVNYSNWAAPIVPVLKSNGHVRICGDYKVTVNKVSKLEQYPIPTLEDLTIQLGKGSLYHKLDLSHAYTQMELDEESRKFLTINTHKGLFTFKRLPYGVSSAPAIFQRVMESILQGIPSTVVYFDDILITGETEELSFQNLEKVLAKLDNVGVKLKEEKCVFGAKEVVFLGHKISKKGIRPVEEKIKALVQAKAPENVQQLKAYLGLLNYYGRFLRNLSAELHPLHKLLQKKVKWIWGQEQQTCFEKTKKMILSAKVLVFYEPSKRLILHT